ncbi:tetratricopeptide repeat protein [Rhodovibrio sodomensis]|uniref:tetratricopeptide repeat protein n=1 Tax=Rhodovibrio sodomensis TaxID=1088 RepID=UPI001905B19A
MSDIFREVDEEIRKERYATLWKKYGAYVIALAVVIVLAVAGYQGWQQWQRSQALEAADSYNAAVAQLQQGNTEQGLQRLAEMADPSGDGYALLASFRQADLLAEQGETQQAVQIWNEIAGSGDGPLRQLADIFAVMHQVDSGDPDQLASRLQPLADEGSPYRWTAMELQATLAYKQGDDDRAIDLFKQIADGGDVPPAQRRRATQMLELLQE